MEFEICLKSVRITADKSYNSWFHMAERTTQFNVFIRKLCFGIVWQFIEIQYEGKV